MWSKRWGMACLLVSSLAGMACGRKEANSVKAKEPAPAALKSFDGRHELRLLKVLPKGSLTPRAAFPDGTPRRGDETDGFVRGGKTYFTGMQGWVYHLDKDSLEQWIPDGRVVDVAPDGQEMIVEIRATKSDQESYFWQDAEGKRTGIATESQVLYDQAKIHPGGACFMTDSPYEGGNQAAGVILWSKDGKAKWEVKRSATWNVPIEDKVMVIREFTMDGNHAIAWPVPRLLDFRKKRLLPLDPESDPRKTPDQDRIMSDLYSRDASLVGGFSENFDDKGKQIALYLWDRVSKKYRWKGKELGAPVCFSGNDEYLLVRGGNIIRSETGEVVFKGLKGKQGKFSPDGRSLVTVDDEAFYVYTLPKESEPIFGVFQKPEPWSPPKAPAQKPKDKAKTK